VKNSNWGAVLPKPFPLQDLVASVKKLLTIPMKRELRA
jgi:hypothetical protein